MIGVTCCRIQFLLKACQLELEWDDLGSREGVLGLDLSDEVGVLVIGVFETAVVV